MKFTPVSPEDKGFPVVPAGTYVMTAVTATEKTSSNGNPMISVKYHVLHPASGETVTVFDHLVGTETAIWKVASFCESAGLSEKYEAGTLEAVDVEGKEVQAELRIDEDPQFGARNVVKKYVGNPYSRAT